MRLGFCRGARTGALWRSHARLRRRTTCACLPVYCWFCSSRAKRVRFAHASAASLRVHRRAPLVALRDAARLVLRAQAYPTIATCALCWGILYMFWALAIVCDDYFVDSLQLLCEMLHV